MVGLIGWGNMAVGLSNFWAGTGERSGKYVDVQICCLGEKK